MAHRITSPQDLLALRDKARARIALRAGVGDVQITVHMGTCGIAAGARDILTALAAELESAAVYNVLLRQSGCAGLCDREPLITVTDAEGHTFRYGRLDAKKVHRIVQEHILGGTPVAELLLTQ